MWEHREGLIEGFTKRYGLTRLVYAEPHDEIASAIQRERNMKHWSRAWKVRLILLTNRNGTISTSIWCEFVDGRDKPLRGRARSDLKNPS